MRHATGHAPCALCRDGPLWLLTVRGSPRVVAQTMGYMVQLEAQTREREPGSQGNAGLLEKRWLLSALLRALSYLHATTPTLGESLVPLPDDDEGSVLGN